ncbi:MAG: hypothetical protein OXH70_12170 [Acidobacteria bacterium]|nr:hypothetical protein [Acidobacteriota bacterium]
MAEMATNRAEELSLRSAVMAASNTRTRDALEEEITNRVERIRELKKRFEDFELSPLESEIQQEIERYDAEPSARGLERVLSDLVVDHLRTEARSGQSEVEALRRLING